MPKPQPAAFATVFGLDGLAPERAAMFEDDHRNLAVPHALGMRTVLVGPLAEYPHVHHATDDLVAFLALVTPDEGRRSRRRGRRRRSDRRRRLRGGGVRDDLRRPGAAGDLGRRRRARTSGARPSCCPRLRSSSGRGCGARWSDRPRRSGSCGSSTPAAPRARSGTASTSPPTRSGRTLFGYNLPNWLLRREMVARLDALPGAALRAPAAVERITPRTSEAIVALADGSAGTRGAGRSPPTGATAACARFSGSARGAGATARRRWSSPSSMRGRTATPRPRSTARAGRSRWCRFPTGQKGTDRRWCGWRKALRRPPSPRCRRRTSMPRWRSGPAGSSARSVSPAPGGLWPIVTQVADRLDGPRTALVAEAAHVVPPIGAQGLNMSLRDIATLLDLCVEARSAGAGHRRRRPARALPPRPPCRPR